eukprot:CAMPEP_0168209638 /NCGR_PEP_ID=MMETSP0140_2-20121125/2734_1 /TAXON_ID=44445 /ORGANISM="Pseudo-nitzschia australis, Strain 10249 10 AB" /LENGTH=290 /DNA_ID=CAMNT_0008136167 /DNA_START=3 /DNA_END=872 /DNA_ORIENTATION=-
MGETIDHETFRLDIVIPTGAMGNIAGCYMAKKLGIPFGILSAGVNVNDFTHRAFSTGLVKRPAQGECMKTSLSDAINIQLPYNLERLLYYLTGEDHDQVKSWYNRLEDRSDSASTSGDDNGRGRGLFDLKESPEWWTKLQTEFGSAKVNDEELCATMRRVLDDYGYWIDPHTGVAFAAADKLGYNKHENTVKSNTAGNENENDSNDNDNNHNTSVVTAVAIMATASPCKFQNVLTTALGAERWNVYERDHFPSRGKDLEDKEEIPPVLYVAESGKTLEENQLIWEAKTRE